MTTILLGNLELKNPHGSEIWTWTIAEYLKASGFAVTILTNTIGEFANDYLSDIEVVTDVSGRKFDFGIISHARLLENIASVNVQKAVLVSHGCIADNERPIEKFNYPHVYVSVSEEVKAHWNKMLGIESSVIVSPIRDDWFKMKLSDSPLYAVVYASHRHQIPEAMRNAFESAGVRVRRIKRGHSQKEVMAIIEASQLLIGTGRYIYEAMAAGRRVIVADSENCLGYVTRINYKNLLSYNMTLRNPEARVMDWGKIISDYPKHNPAYMRDIALKNHHVSKIVKNLLEQI